MSNQPKKSSSSPNPKRVAAGKRNCLKRGPWTPEARERQRQNALAFQPWRHSTGPRTPEGKAKAAANCRRRQKGDVSIRQLEREVAGVVELIEQMRTVRGLLGAKASGGVDILESGLL